MFIDERGGVVHSRLTRTLAPGPGEQRTAVFVDLFERANNVIHIRSRAQEDALFQPDSLPGANEIAIRAMHLSIVQPAAFFGKVWPERLLQKQRLTIQ